MKPFPDSLRAAAPADGHALARQLAEFALAGRDAAPRDIAAHLSSPPAPAIETLTALYFQTVSAANGGWLR
ncbi:MAG: hypothetical protein NTV51_00490 [Verrucomicrobia bacterium]|nr:hypothetical protein [Verrucomicrobiota bacterium]